MKLYVCKNPSCDLGSLAQLGRFTGGMTKEAFHLKTGQPLESLEKGVHFGEGMCPNCVAVVDGKPRAVMGEPYDESKATATAIKEAKERHAAELAAIKEGVA